MADDTPSSLDGLVEDLKTFRDQVKVKAHLAGKDLEDFVEKHQATLERLEGRVEGAVDAAGEHLPAAQEAATRLFREVKAGFEDARRRLRQG